MDGDGDKNSAHRTTISKYSVQTYTWNQLICTFATFKLSQLAIFEKKTLILFETERDYPGLVQNFAAIWFLTSWLFSWYVWTQIPK